MIRRTVAPSGLIAASTPGFYPVVRAALQEFWASISRAAGSPGSGVAQSTARAIAAATASAAALPSEARSARAFPTDRQKRASPSVGRGGGASPLEPLEAQPRHARGLGLAEGGRRGDDADGGVDGAESGGRRAGLE